MSSPDLCKFRELAGDPGASRASAVAAFAEMGIPVARSTIPCLRQGDGNGILTRLCLVLFTEANNPAAKIEHYLSIGQNGVDLRRPQKERPHRFSPDGLTQDITQQLGLTVAELSRRLRAIRVDAVASAVMEPDQRITPIFLAAATEYIDAYTKPVNADVNKKVKAISEKWNGLTIGDFYRTLYAETSGPGISTWIPYEAGFIKGFYQMLKEGKPQLSPFDRFALKAMITGNARRYSGDLRQWTGILVDRGVIYSHVAVLTASLMQRRD